MKKTALLSLLLLTLALLSASAAAGVALDAAHFPDENFRGYVARFDGDTNGVLADDELQAVTEINCSGMHIADLTGIEHFSALTHLYCDRNRLTALDVSRNIALFSLNVDINRLTALDVSRNTALNYLRCSGNQLAALDVSHNPRLYKLDCVNNQLKALDVSRNFVLSYLECDKNRLTTLDLSKNPVLNALSCSDNQLTALISHSFWLTDLSCHGNQLTALDISNDPALKHLYCSDNHLTALDVSHNPQLTKLNCSGNNLVIPTGRFALSALPGFEPERASGWTGGQVENGILTPDDGATQITYTYDCGNRHTAQFCLTLDPIALDAAHFPDENFRGYIARFDRNKDSILNRTELAAVKTISCSGMGIADLTGIGYFSALEYLYCYDNQLTTLDVNNNTALTNLWCSSNRLTKLDVSQNSSLTSLRCSSNQLTALDVSKNTKLRELECSGNALEIPWGAFELSSLPGFEPALASDWEGGNVADGLVIPGLHADNVSYTYDCGKGFSKRFTLKLTRAKLLALPADLRRIESEAFMDAGAAAYILPAGIEAIAADAFPADAILYYPADTATAQYCEAHAAALPRCLPCDPNP